MAELGGRGGWRGEGLKAGVKMKEEKREGAPRESESGRRRKGERVTRMERETAVEFRNGGDCSKTCS